MSDQVMPAAEESVILSCLSRIRWRLWAVRLAERAALALAWGGAMALFLLAGRVVRDRWWQFSIVLALMPIAAGVWLWFAGPEISRGVLGSTTRRAAILLAGAMALALGIAAGYYLSVAGILHGVPLFVASVVALIVPLAAVVALWISFPRIQANAFSKQFVLGAGLLTVAVGLATGACLLLPATAHLPTWTLCVGPLIFLAAAAATVRPVNPSAAAIFVDQHVGLSERVSTALEFFQTEQPGSPLEAAFRAPVIASAVNACQTVRSAKVGYRRMDSRAYPLAATIAIAAAAICFLPPMQPQARANHAPYLSVVHNGHTLADKLKELELDKKIAEDPKAKEMLKQFSQLANQMKQGDMSPFEASEKMSSMMAGIKKDEAAAQAAQDVQKAFSKDFGELGRAGDELRSATVNGAKGEAGAAQQKQSAQSDVNKAAGEMGEKLKGMSEQEKKDLAEKLENAANKAGGDPELQKELQGAAKAAREGNSEQLSQNMAGATNRAAEQGAQKASQDELNQTMEKIAQAGSSGLSQGEQQASRGDSGEQNGGGNQEQQGGQNPSGSEGQQGQQQAGGGDQQQGGQQQGEGQQQGGQQGAQQGGGDKTASGGQGKGDTERGQSSESSTNLHNPSGPGNRDFNGGIGSSETYVKIYDEKNVDSRGKTERAQGKINPIAPPSGTVQMRGEGDKGDPSITTYKDILPQQRQRILDDLPTQQIPPKYKDLIRDYYNDKK